MQTCDKAVRKVRNPLPAPEHCRYCGSAVHFVNNAELYGKSYGSWPYGYLCGFCDAYVGCHPQTRIPLGVLATGALRQLRAKAHAAFDPLWKSHRMSRGAAYGLLAQQLGIQKESCHISWFDRDECEKTISIANELCKQYQVTKNV